MPRKKTPEQRLATQEKADVNAMLTVDLPAFFKQKQYDPVLKIHETLVKMEECLKEPFETREFSREHTTLLKIYLDTQKAFLPYMMQQKAAEPQEQRFIIMRDVRVEKTVEMEIADAA